MDWLIAAAQQPSTSTNPDWYAPLLGGVGALVGGSLSSLVAWFVLADTRKARRRAEEKEATATITTALLKVRQIYRNTDVGSGSAPEGFEYWSDYLLSKLGKAEVAVMAFRNESLRTRLAASLDLLIWGAHDDRLLHETGLGSTRVVAYVAHQDAMTCLGTSLRGKKKLPEATKAWRDADDHMQWMIEEERRATEGE